MGVTDTGWGGLRWQACALAVLGKHDLALEVFEASAAAPNMAFLPVLRDSACFRDLHDEPRYQAAIRSLQARHDAIRERLPATLAYATPRRDYPNASPRSTCCGLKNRGPYQRLRHPPDAGGGSSDRFKVYIDLNPMRADLVEDRKDYRFCGYAEASVLGSKAFVN